MIENPSIHYLGTLFFALAVMHTFVVGLFRKLSHRYPHDSFRHSLFHLLGEVEVVFGVWAGIFSIVAGIMVSFTEVVKYLEGLHFTEPIFVFCIMVVSATKPVLWLAREGTAFLSGLISRALGTRAVLTDLATLLIIGPLIGSFITESGAITVTALLLLQMIKKSDQNFNYSLLALLFVSISVGGAMTPFAAPPILMVVSKWNWGFSEVFSMFGTHAIAVVLINSLGFVWWKKDQILENMVSFKDVQNNRDDVPFGVVALHYVFLVLIVLAAHHPVLAVTLLLFFLGVTVATQKYQNGIKFKESLLVAFFLGGLIFFGPFQAWWLAPVLDVVKDRSLFFLATGLTAITDNAALTYLGAQVPGLSDSSKYYLVAGALTGGGLTIIANAPNPAGFSILQKHFPNGLNAGKLFLAAIPPTIVAILCFGFLP